MKYTLDWLTNPEVFAVNRIAAHSDHKIYANHLEADADNSSLIQNLNGTWKFAWAKNPSEWQQKFYEESDSTDKFDNIQVPGHMELQGYGKPQYVNTIYPWEGQEHLRPPFISEKDNPVGSYVRYFDLNDALKNKRVFISFQGVETAMYVWLNGEFIGYSEDSFTPSEFELTPYIREKGNKLAVAVFKRSSASWLEDQDFWRFSGIFRDVFLYAAPSAHVRDMRVIADYDGTNGIFSATLDIAGKCSVKSILTDENGTVIAESNEKESVHWTIENSKPWSAEIPNLYTFTVILTDEDGNEIEVSRTKVGFRRFELKNGIMCLNGKRIIFKGINRHEFDAKTGRAITKEDMLFDIQFMKKNNINAVRTCHYPNNSLWYQLCDAYGIYLIDETNLETHGTWQKLGATDPSWNVPGSLPEWKEVVLDRAKSMYERDKNHASVLIWSCGNESYCGEDIAAMSEYFRSVDPTRLVHYEGVTRVPNHQYDFITDMESRMYAKPQEVEEYLKQNNGRPYISCEYMHAMGNSLGGLSLYTDLEDKYEAYQGGFIWDYIDQSIYKKDRYGKEFQAYGGDFGERPTDYNFSGNGIAYGGDRTPSPKMQEVKFNYQNITAEVTENAVKVINKNLFVNTDTFRCEVTLAKNGHVLCTETLETSVEPLSEKTYALPFGKQQRAGEYTVTVSFLLREKTLWAEAGHEVAFGQYVYKVEGEEKAPVSGVEIVRSLHNIGVRGENFEVMFSVLNGGLVSYKYAGREMIEAIPKPNFWRAPTDNDCGNQMPMRYAQWKIASMYASHKEFRRGMYGPSNAPETTVHDNSVEVAFTYIMPTTPVSECRLAYEVFGDGRVKTALTYDPVKELGDMPEFGVLFKFNADYDHVKWYGLGPAETYADRKHGAKLGIYENMVTDNLARYLVPQECGSKEGVRWAKITDRKGRGMLFEMDEKNGPMMFSALPYTPHEMENAMHPYELPEIHYTVVRAAKAQMGVGGDDSWGSYTHPEYLLDTDKKMEFSFVFKGL